MVGLGSAGHTCLIRLLIRLAYHTCSNSSRAQLQNKSHSRSCMFESKHTTGSTPNIQMWEKKRPCRFQIKFFIKMPRIILNTVYFLFESFSLEEGGKNFFRINRYVYSYGSYFRGCLCGFELFVNYPSKILILNSHLALCITQL